MRATGGTAFPPVASLRVRPQRLHEKQKTTPDLWNRSKCAFENAGGMLNLGDGGETKSQRRREEGACQPTGQIRFQQGQFGLNKHTEDQWIIKQKTKGKDSTEVGKNILVKYV